MSPWRQAPTSFVSVLMSSPGSSAAESWVDRNFSRMLAAVAAASLVPYLIFSQFQFIDYDGWWHLFTATQDRWIIFLGEWKYEAHPPLHFLLLRLVAALGHSHVMLRSISIVSGCIATYVMGIVASKIYRNKTSALLVAGAYAFAWCMIDINCAVRGYALALLFVLLAFNAYLDYVADPAGPRAGGAIVRFGVYSLVALLSEYYAIFFIAACGCMLVLRALAQPVFRTAWIRSLRVDWKQWLFSMVSIAGLFLAFFKFHMVVSVPNEHYLDDYFYSENSPLGLDGFLRMNFSREFGYFAPFGLDQDLMLALLGLVVFPALVYFTFVRKGRWRGPLAVDAPLVVCGLLGQLVILSLVDKHPFGGEFRHQSIIAPFVFLTLFLALDRFADALRTPLRNGLFAAAGLAVAASFAYGWTVYPWNPTDNRSAENAQFRQLFPSPEGIYGDIVSVNQYYASVHQAKWTYYDRYLVGGERIVSYQMDDGTGHPVRVMRNKGGAYFDLLGLNSYQVLAEALRHEKLKSAVLLFDGPSWDAKGARTIEDTLRKLAPMAGLEVGRASVSTT